MENDIFVVDFATKAEIFNGYFMQQCTTIDTGSTIPQNIVPSAPPLTELTISDETIQSIIRSLNPSKAHGWDDISIRMIQICDGALLLALKLLFENCLHHGIFPEIWKKPNVVFVLKRILRIKKKIISLLPIFGKIL